MKKATQTLFLVLFGLIFTATAFSQNRPEEGSIGLSVEFQGDQTSLMLPIWTTEDIVIAPVIGIVHESDSFTTLNLGIKPRFYRDLGTDFASYFGFQGLLRYTSRDILDDITNFLVGVNGGGEYYLSNRFSIGVEGQLNLLIRENDENRLATGAAISASYYF